MNNVSPEEYENNTDIKDNVLSEMKQQYKNKLLQGNGITILRIEDDGGHAVLHYRLKTTEKSLPSQTNFTLTGKLFNESLINDGSKKEFTYTLEYELNFTLCKNNCKKR